MCGYRHIWTNGDDFAGAQGLFISLDTCRRMAKPFHKRIADTAKRINPEIVVKFHLCGLCESVLDDFVEIGVEVWQPVQPLNDLAAIKSKYGNRLVLNGGWDNVDICSRQEISEEEVRKSVRDTFDTCAPGGGFVFWDGGPMGSGEQTLQRLAWANKI